MKKLLWILLLISILLPSCGKKPIQAEKLLRYVLEDNPHFPSAKVIYHSDALPGEQAYMTPRLRSLLYDEGRGRQIPEFDGVEEYAVCLSDGTHGMEIHIFYMESPSDARNMQKLLLRRVQLMKRRSLYLYAPEAYERYFSSASVYRKGRFVMLLATGENERVWDRIKTYLG